MDGNETDLNSFTTVSLLVPCPSSISFRETRLSIHPFHFTLFIRPLFPTGSPLQESVVFPSLSPIHLHSLRSLY